MLSVILATTLSILHYSTPQAAAIGAFGAAAARPAVVERVNVVGRYAVVLTKGEIVEGEQLTDPILLERFSFGWQPLEILNVYCALYRHRLGTALNASLLRGMPVPKLERRPCYQTQDTGPTADVASVRGMMRGPLVPHVGVSGDWAMGDWYGAGGGEKLFKRRSKTWTLIAGGGGAMGTDEMIQYGVPRSAWCSLGVYNAKCP